MAVLLAGDLHIVGYSLSEHQTVVSRGSPHEAAVASRSARFRRYESLHDVATRICLAVAHHLASECRASARHSMNGKRVALWSRLWWGPGIRRRRASFVCRRVGWCVGAAWGGHFPRDRCPASLSTCSVSSRRPSRGRHGGYGGPISGYPSDYLDARDALQEAWRRSEVERVEIACRGGRGRTGTSLACLAVLDGVPAEQAVAYVREHYNIRAVETPWQRWYVRKFSGR